MIYKLFRALMAACADCGWLCSKNVECKRCGCRVCLECWPGHCRTCKG